MLLLLIAVSLIAPKLIGKIAMQEHNQIVQLADESEILTITSQETEVNWFGGRVVTEYILDDAELQLGRLKLSTEEIISFGPVMFADGGIHFGFYYATTKITLIDTENAETVNNFIEDNVKLTTLVTFSQSAVTTLEVAKVSEEVDGAVIKSEPLFFEFSIKKLKQLSYQLNWGGMEINSPELPRFLIGAFSSNGSFDIVKGSLSSQDALLDGSSELSLASFEAVDDESNALFKMKNLEFSASSISEDYLMQSNLSYQVGEIEAEGSIIKDIMFSAELDKFDQSHIVKIQENLLVIANGNTNEEQVEQAELKLFEELKLFLAEKPTIKIKDYSFATPEGKFNSKFELSFNDPSGDVVDMDSLFLLLNVTGDLSIDDEVLKKHGVDFFAENFIEQGFLLKQNGVISTAVDFSNGMLKLNGREFHL